MELVQIYFKNMNTIIIITNLVWNSLGRSDPDQSDNQLKKKMVWFSLSDHIPYSEKITKNNTFYPAPGFQLYTPPINLLDE